jgi:hypothetical protein
MEYKPKHYDGSIDKEDCPCHSNKSAKDEAYFGRKKCDPPLSLFTSSIDSMLSTGMNYTAILTMGDFAGHNIPVRTPDMDEVIAMTKLKWALENITQLLVSAFPNIPIAFTVGNNDFVYHEEVPTPDFKDEFYGYLYNLWFEKVPSNAKINTPENKRNFLTGGYYSFDLTPAIKMININSLYYFMDNPQNDHETGYNQLLWLESQLSLTRSQGKTALIISHFPNGPNTNKNDVKIYWDPVFDLQFQDILYRYNDVVNLVLSGHTHFDDIRVNNLGFGARGSSFYNNNVVLRAICPRSSNNPGYAVLEYLNNIPKYIYSYTFLIDDAINTKNATQYWKQLYRSDILLNITDYTGLSIANFQSTMLNNATLYARYDNIRRGIAHT